MPEYAFSPIGFARTPFQERAVAPRQPAASPEAPARIQLLPGCGFEDALEGLDGWDYAWLLFVFHRNVEQGRGWKPKVQPPRADRKLGVFATRSPHRPNPIGLSLLQIERVEGLVVHGRGVDLLDGTPILDLKPYVPYADARQDARSGWLEPQDPRRSWDVRFTDGALERLEWLRVRGVDLRKGIESALALGPQPHAYRRIRRHEGGLRLAIKAWRVDFSVDGHCLVVHDVRSGYRPKQLATEAGIDAHRAFTRRFDPATR